MQIHTGVKFLCSCARPGILVILCSGLILFSCSPFASEQTAASPTPQIATPVLQVHEIRIGLVGKPTDVNVWALFDEEGMSYANYALRWEYWPRLYTLSIPELEFIPQAAKELPSKVFQDGDFYVATVNMRDDLTWSDGKPLTAEDAAFTINTALAFELGYDWKTSYDPDYLDRVETGGASTLRYYFKKAPHVGVWQYGILQGPIVQKSYWEPRIQEAVENRPDDSLDQAIVDAEAGKTTLENEVNELTDRIRNLQQTGGQDRQLDAALKRAQANLDAANNSISKLKEEQREKYFQARLALYSLDDTSEPTLGNWIPQGGNSELWTNSASSISPFFQPHFDLASFSLFDNESSAVSALQADEVDLILQPRGLSEQAVTELTQDTSIRLMQSPSRSTQFLIVNPADPVLSNPALRQALACMLANDSSNQFNLEKYSLTGLYTPDYYWRTSPDTNGCSTASAADRLQHAVEILKKAGYAWRVEPKPGVAGADLVGLNGARPSQLTIIAPVSDPLAEEIANQVKEMFLQLGISAVSSLVDASEVNYEVFSSRQYDLAILGWNLSRYPAYLCDWFTGIHNFLAAGQELEVACASLEVETDLDKAQAIIQNIQDILYKDAQLIPLITESRFDAYRNIAFPFESIVEGLSGIFVAPSLALPAP